jgi:hypothetical protein
LERRGRRSAKNNLYWNAGSGVPQKIVYIGTPGAAFPTPKRTAQGASMALLSVKIYQVKESD